jgi:response regulator of citrate/malate metabolism|tara:strand:- start:477 stop:725 length:249 start_codon:yes stop_codon:yes gene_type:complete
MSTQLNTENVKPLVKRGRKPVSVTWPDEEFTASELSDSMGDKLSRVSVHTKINNALEDGELVLVRVVKSKMGRPHSIYRKVS